MRRLFTPSVLVVGLVASLIAVDSPATASASDRLVLDLGSTQDKVTGMTVQEDGKILLVGTTYVDRPPVGDSDLFLVRVMPDLTLDPTFGQGGIVIDHLGGYEFAGGVGVTSDGVTWVNAANEVSWFLVSYDSVGTRLGGVGLWSGAGPSIAVRGMTVDAQGRLVATSGIQEHSTRFSFVARHDPVSGVTDTIDTSVFAWYVAAIPYGPRGVLVAGDELYEMGVARINGTFQIRQTAKAPVGKRANDLFRAPSGVVAVAGVDDAGMAVARMAPDGSHAGVVLPQFKEAFAVLMDDEGRIVVGGTDGVKAVVARLVYEDGGLLLDPDFGVAGAVVMGKDGGYAVVRGMALVGGALYAGGYGSRAGEVDYEVFLVRFD